MRRLLVFVLAFSALAPAVAQAKHKPRRCSAKATATRCLAKLRGAEPVRVLANGRVPKTAALQAFAALYGPLPGVEVNRRATGDLFDGTSVLAAVAAQRRHLGARQRRAIDRRLGALSGAPGSARVAGGPIPDVEARTKSWTAALKQAQQSITALYGVAPVLPVYVTLLNTPDADTHADSSVIDTAIDGKPQKACQVRIYPQTWGQADQGPTTDVGRFIAAHEAFHCFQFDGRNGKSDQPSWFAEGSANWVAGKVLQASGRSAAGWDTLQGHWSDWLDHPTTPLFTRTYSAMGFFAQLDSAGLDVWALLRQMVKLNDSDKLYALADKAFLGTWGSNYLRRPHWGVGWDLNGPSITQDRPSILQQGVGTGQTRVVTAAPRSAALRTLDLTADVVEVSTHDAHGRLRDANGVDIGLADGVYCARDDACANASSTCPGLPRIADGDATLAIAADGKAGTVTVKGQSLKAFCKGKKRPANATSIAIDGASTGTIAEDGSCNTKPDTASGEIRIFFYPTGPGSQGNRLSIVLRGWHGQGEYGEGYGNELSYAEGKTQGGRYFDGFTYDDPVGYDDRGYPVFQDSWTVTVDRIFDTGMTGTVNAVVRDTHDHGALANVKGTWTCSTALFGGSS